MARWKSLGIRITESEYRANVNGLNIFFGAALGFVITGADRLGALSFTVLMVLCAAIVVAILYISASRRPSYYFLYCVVIIAVLPRIFEPLSAADEVLPSKLQPTLAVWATMMFLIELLPREPEPRPEIASDDHG